MKTFKNQVIVVTGGAGAIGVNLVQMLLKENPSKIVIIDNFSSGQAKYLPIDRKVVICYCDIANAEKLQPLIPKDTDYIFHLAAHFANQNSVDYPLSDIQTNVIGTINLLEISRQLNVKKFVNCSSSCVYGNSTTMMESDKIFPDETPYAINKYVTELYAAYYSKQFDLPTISVRLFNTYGPYELAGQYRNVIPKFIDCALRNQQLTITGTGEETRDFTYVLDTCSLFKLAAISDKRCGETFNGGTGSSVSIYMLAEMIISISNSKSEINHIERREWDEIQHRKADIEKSREILGYNPIHLDIKKNLFEVISWYKDQI